MMTRKSTKIAYVDLSMHLPKEYASDRYAASLEASNRLFLQNQRNDDVCCDGLSCDGCNHTKCKTWKRLHDVDETKI